VFSRKIVVDMELALDILFDPGNQVAARYGVRWFLPEDLREIYQKFGIDLAMTNGEDSWSLPFPACIIIDSEGVVRNVRVNPDYTRRPEPEETLDHLRKIVG
jgi:peroxiredoxin